MRLSMKSVMHLLSLLSVLCVATTSAAGEDFNITVPVNISNLPPEIQTVTFGCNVFQESYGISLASDWASALVTVVDGGYHGDVTMRFNAASGHDPATAHYYECRIVEFIARNGVIYNFNDVSAPHFPLQPGAALMLDTHSQPIPH